MKHSRLHIVSRVAASIVGGYVFVWGCVVLGMALLLAAGMPYDDARVLAAMLAFLVFVVCFCWAFAAASLARVWSVLAGGGLLMTGAAWWLLQTLA